MGDSVHELEERVELLEGELSELVASRAFCLGDGLLGKLAPRAAPRPRTAVPPGLPAKVHRQRLAARCEELERLIALTKGGLRLSLGRALEAGRGHPGRWPAGALLSGRLLTAALARAAGRRLRPVIQPTELVEVSDWSPDAARAAGDLRVTVYAEVDPNRIDGATVWLASLCEVLAARDDIRLTVLLAAPLRRPEMLGHLRRRARLRLLQVDPPPQRGCLSPARALRALAAIDRDAPQDLFLVRGPGAFRGGHLTDALAARPALAARSWVYLVDPSAYERPLRRARLWRVADAAGGLLCQTPEARRHLAELLAGSGAVEPLVLPPMIPATVDRPRRRPEDRPLRLVYSGKFSPPYRLLEMLAVFADLRRRRPGMEFHVVGDKFHNRPVQAGFERRLLEALTGPGVVWHGGLSRQQTMAIIERCDVACSWRDESFDHSLELATKVLEAAGRGLPVVLNPTAMHRRLLGEDYPAYAADAAGFEVAVARLAERADAYETASTRCLQVARGFTYDRAGTVLQAVLDRCRVDR